MNKKKLNLLALGIIALMSTNCSATISGTFKDRPWEFLEYKLISKPSATARIYQTALGGSTFMGMLSCIMVADRHKAKVAGIDSKEIAYYGLFGCMGLLISGSIFINYYKEHQLVYTAIQQLVANWPKYRDYTPVEFQDVLQELYEQYGRDIAQLPAKKALKVANIIRVAVMNRNPKKYYNKVIDSQQQPQMVIHSRAG